MSTPKTRLAKKDNNLDSFRVSIHRIAEKYDVCNIRVFGSFARGDQNELSDIDLLVDLPEGMTLIGLSSLKIDLEEELKRDVDIVPSDSIKPALKERILSEARIL